MAHEKQTDTRHGGSSNFANDPQRASEAGKKGGAHSHGGSQESVSDDASQEKAGASRGTSGNFANDREKASEAGKKGGEHSHAGK
jgi:uncharacterized protein